MIARGDFGHLAYDPEPRPPSVTGGHRPSQGIRADSMGRVLQPERVVVRNEVHRIESGRPRRNAAVATNNRIAAQARVLRGTSRTGSLNSHRSSSSGGSRPAGLGPGGSIQLRRNR